MLNLTIVPMLQMQMSDSQTVKFEFINKGIISSCNSFICYVGKSIETTLLKKWLSGERVSLRTVSYEQHLNTLTQCPSITAFPNSP